MTVMSERDEVREWHLLEQDGTRRASDLGIDKPSSGDVEFFTKVADASGEMKQKYLALKENTWADFIGHVGYAAQSATGDAKKCQMFAKDGVTRRYCKVDSETFEQAKRMDSYYNYINSDEKPPPATSYCTHLISTHVVDKDSIRLPALINDVIACFHRSLEHYENQTRHWHKEGKCLWRE